MRVTAYAALAATLPTRAARAALFEAAARDADGYVAGHARLRLAQMERASTISIVE
jgi:hypothetical protein